MREIFNRRFWKYFVITFFLTLFFSALGAANNYLDLFIANSTPLKTLYQLCLYVALGLIPASLCVSTALASFISFRNLLPDAGIKSFFSKLGIGLVCFIPLSIAIYLFDLYIQPRFLAGATEILWEMKTGNSFRAIGDDYMQSPGFENYTPGLSSKKVLYFRLDSLETECKELRDECSTLLTQLPDSAAAEAYDVYQLEWLGVDYQSASSHISLNSDSIIYIQQEELFYTAGQLHESNIERLAYRFEHYKRMTNAIVLLLEFLVFATLGYFFRKKPIKNILGIIAIITVAGLFLLQIGAMGKRYADDANSRARSYEREMRDRRFK